MMYFISLSGEVEPRTALAAPAAMTAWSRISQREPFSENTAAFSPGSSPSSCTAFRPTSMASASSAYE